MTKIVVSNKELEILKIFWEEHEPLTAKQINERNEDLVMSTIQSVLKKLMSKNLIKVNDIVYSGTVLTRNYLPCITEEEFILDQYSNLSVSKLVSFFLGNSEGKSVQKEINEIEQLIEKRKREDS